MTIHDYIHTLTVTQSVEENPQFHKLHMFTQQSSLWYLELFIVELFQMPHLISKSFFLISCKLAVLRCITISLSGFALTGNFQCFTG